MATIPTLETDRLLLRPFRLADAPEVQRLAGDRMVADTTLNVPHPYRAGMAESWISSHAKTFDENAGVTFAITEKNAGTLIGAIGLRNLIPGHQAEMGYWIGVPFWKQGFCTEAGLAVLRYAFAELGLARIHASYLTRNPASGRVMQKLGMRHEGSRKGHARKWDKLEDLELYGILKSDFPDARR